LSDYKAFHDAWSRIPSQSGSKFIEDLQKGMYWPENAIHGEAEVFAPVEANTLVPFFIEASRSTDENVRWVGFCALCGMKDPRAIAWFTEVSSHLQDYKGFEKFLVPRCMRKYAMFGLLPQKKTI
jgi:hypothetical protein